jgi:hypothetical protein
MRKDILRPRPSGPVKLPSKIRRCSWCRLAAKISRVVAAVEEQEIQGAVSVSR